MNTNIQLFESKNIRTTWNEEEEEWYFSVVDVIGVLTDSPDPKRYWSVLKTRLKKEGAESTTICSTFKLPAQDGKMRMTDVASTEQLFRIIQFVPSPKAEPFKLWLAEVARQGGQVARNARLELEAKTGKKVVSPLNAKNVLSIGEKDD